MSKYSGGVRKFFSFLSVILLITTVFVGCTSNLYGTEISTHAIEFTKQYMSCGNNESYASF